VNHSLPTDPDPRYPLGPFEPQPTYSSAERTEFIQTLEQCPGHLRAAVAGLSDGQLETPYRPGGWTVRQVVHHVPDSHLNAFVRMKLALTEDRPIIKPYDEAAWALLPDSRGPCEPSLALLEALHSRWVELLRGLHERDWRRGFVHPELLAQARIRAVNDPGWARGVDAADVGLVTLEAALGTYAWHSRHHVAHVTRLRERMGW
jgi:DinB superfamily